MKHTIRLYPVTVMSELEVEAPSEAEAIIKAERIAMSGGCKFYSPDRRMIGLVYKEKPKQILRAGKSTPKPEEPKGTIYKDGSDKPEENNGNE